MSGAPISESGPAVSAPSEHDVGAAGARVSERSRGKIWTAGSLTYGTGALVMLFCWLLLGDFAWSMRDRSVGPMAQWLLKQLDVSNLLFGLLVSTFPAVVGLVLGPVVSVRSDRHRGPRGRRIPFLLVTTPLAAFGMLGIAFTPLLAGWVHGFLPDVDQRVVALGCFAVFWAAFEFATIAGQAVFGGLINDVVPKELLGRFYGLFRAVSLVDGILFNYWIMGKVPDHFTLILAIIALFYGAAFMWVCLKVREGEYPPVEEASPAGKGASVWRRGRSAVETYFRECFANRYYVSVFLMLTTAAMAFLPINTFGIPYARSLEMDMGYYGKCLALTFFVSLCLSYFLGWLSDVFHPLRVSMATLAGYLLVAIFGWLSANTAERFAVAFVMHGVLSGCYFTSAASLGQRLFPHSRYAQFASAAGVMTSVGTIALGPLVGSVIDWSGAIYRHTFLIGALLTLAALVSAWGVHAQFMRLGGPKGYSAPEQARRAGENGEA